ncbi:MAG: type II secretion system protein [Sideroxydans sp.]
MTHRDQQIVTIACGVKRALAICGDVRCVTTRQRSQFGFTLVELITVMVIVGILAVSVLPRFFTVSDFENRGSADQVKSILRFAQKTAIAQHTPVSVTLAQGASSDCTTTLAGGNLTCTVKSELTGAGTYTFNALGQLTAPAAPVTLTIGTVNITVEAETGYVH